MSSGPVQYLAGNDITYVGIYVDQDGEPIDISTTTLVTMYLHLPNRTTRLVVGSYTGNADHNIVQATAVVTNEELGEYRTGQAAVVEWEFSCVIPGQADLEFSTRETLAMNKNLRPATP